MRSRKGQVTLFVILSIVVVISIILFFVLKPTLNFGNSASANPEAYLEKCILDSIKESQISILKNSGLNYSNSKNFILYKSEKIPLMCTSFEFYVACVPQEPGFINKIQNAIQNKALIAANNCFAKMKGEYESKGYSVKESGLKLNVTLMDKQIKVTLEKQFLASKEEQSINLQNFEFIQPSELFGLLKLEQTIINYESTVCEFNELAWMNAMPKIKITRARTSDQLKVYTLEDRDTQDKIKFAIRTCALPAGI